MTLYIYESADPSTNFSQSGSFTNPISLAFNGTDGGVQIKRYFIRNSSSTYFYTNIQLTPTVNSGTNVVNNNNFSIKLIEGSDHPLDAQWALIDAGNTIEFSDLGSSGTPNTSTYLPFWIRIEVPANLSVQSFEGTSLDISATQNLV